MSHRVREPFPRVVRTRSQHSSHSVEVVVTEVPQAEAPPSGAAPTRRTVLVAGVAAAAAGTAVLAGCSSSSSGGVSEGTVRAPATGGGTAQGTSPAAGGDGGATTSASAGGAGGGAVVVVPLASVPVGGSAANASGSIVLAQPTAGAVVAFSSRCTHLGCTVEPAGTEYHCPCHGSVYDAFTGAVKSGPAPRPLGTIPVAVQGVDVVRE